MGNFRIEIEAVGDHGQRREIGDGESLAGDQPLTGCDRVAFEAVRDLLRGGASITSAKLIHWPGTDSEVVDDLVKNEREGSF